jgi:hypothetical protein
MRMNYKVRHATKGVTFTLLFVDPGGPRIEVEGPNVRLYANLSPTFPLEQQAMSIYVSLPLDARFPVKDIASTLRTLLRMATHEQDAAPQA